MADFGQPVAQNVQNPIQTMSQFLGMQQAQQNLQTGQIAQQQAQQNLQTGQLRQQQERQTTQQRQGIANIDWSKYDDGTGTVSTDKMLSDTDLQKKAGDQFPDILQKAAMVRTQQLQNKKSLVDLNDGLRSQFGSMMGAFRNDPDVIADNPAGRQKIAQGIAQFGAAGGPDAQRVADIYAPVVTHAPPGKLQRGIEAIQLQAMDASRQAAAQSPNYVNTGASMKNVNPQAAGGNLSGTPDIANSVAPGTHTFTGADGNLYAFNPQDPGRTILVGHGGGLSGNSQQQNITGINSDTGSHASFPRVTSTAQLEAIKDSIPLLQQELQTAQASGNQANIQAAQRQLSDAQSRLNAGTPFSSPSKGSSVHTSDVPPTMSVGEPGQVQANTDIVNANRKKAADANTQLDVLNKIGQLSSSPNLYLGPMSDNVAKLATAVSNLPGMEGAKQYANNYNELVKFMAQNAVRAGNAMGLGGSDARLDAATHMQPNAQMDQRTIRGVTEYMSGLVKMDLAKANAQDAWLQQPGHSLQNAHQFEQLWRNNADPRLFQMSSMTNQNDANAYAAAHVSKSELADLKKKHDVLAGLGVQF